MEMEDNHICFGNWIIPAYFLNEYIVTKIYNVVEKCKFWSAQVMRYKTERSWVGFQQVFLDM